MPDFEFEGRADFQKMVDAGIEETLTLEYKASPALRRDDIDELCKDVSAMANSAGGQIIYGIEEDRKTHKPSKVDQGVTDPKITREWIHQVLSSNIQPRIDGIKIQRIALSDEGYGYVISVQPTTIGPHQSKDKKYYKRYELQAVPMADYEIRDILNRSRAPRLLPTLSLSDGNKHSLTILPHETESETVALYLSVINESDQPANYTLFTIMLDRNFRHRHNDGWSAVTPHRHEGVAYMTYQMQRGIPQNFPIFKEAPLKLHEPLFFAVGEKFLGMSEFFIFVRIQTPGYGHFSKWRIFCQSAVLQLQGPFDPDS